MKLLEQCHSSILKLCLFHTNRQPDNVKDLYQEIVYNLWRSYPKVRNAGSQTAWVYRVALNTAYMQHRVRRRAPRFISLDDTVYEQVADSNGDEMLDRLYHLIDKLDKEEQTILFLYLDRFPQHDMAEILQTTEAAVNHKINRLKQKLKTLNKNGE